MPADTTAIPSRNRAHPLDRPYDMGRTPAHGVGQDPDAIDGYRGIGWYQHFKDRNTGQIYAVHCSDGVDGGNNTHTWEDEEWMARMHEAICSRINREAERSNLVVISPNEWAILLNYARPNWTETDTTRDLGRVGMIGSTSIVVQQHTKDALDTPPSEQAHVLEQTIAQIDRDEDLADQYAHLCT